MEILTLGEKIKKRRKEMDMTLKDLAGDRITPGQISLVESGRSNPSMDLLEYLANTLNTSIEYLMESEERQAEKICIYYEHMAETYILNSDYVDAEKYIEYILNYSEKYNLEYRKARSLFLRGNIYKEKNKLDLAKQFYLEANDIFIKNDNFEQIIDSFLNIGKIAFELKSYHSSINYFNKAKKVYLDSNIGNDVILAEIYYQIAECYFKIENLDKSIEYVLLAKEKFKQVQNKKEYGKTLMLLSKEYNKKGDIVNAIKYSKKTLDIYKELEKEKNISNAENNLGNLFFEFNNIKEAFEHYETAKYIRIRNKDSEAVNTLIDICKAYIKIREIKKCEEIFNQINTLIDEDNLEQVIERNILAYRIDTINEKFDNLESILLETFNIAKLAGLNKKAAEVAVIIGRYYTGIKKDKEAAKYLGESVNIFRNVGILSN